MKNPEPPCLHSPLPLPIKIRHQVLSLLLSWCLSNHLILPTPSLMVKVQALLIHRSDTSNNACLPIWLHACPYQLLHTLHADVINLKT